jgi:hypothetical protein
MTVKMKMKMKMKMKLKTKTKTKTKMKMKMTMTCNSLLDQCRTSGRHCLLSERMMGSPEAVGTRFSAMSQPCFSHVSAMFQR